MEKLIARNAIRDDVLFFMLPAAFVFSAGMAVSAWELIRQQGSLYILSAPSVVGLALIVIGLTINLTAAGTLRRSYSPTLVTREDHELVTRGVYRLLRHPIYLGTIMASVGLPVYVPSLYGLLTMSALVLLFLRRIGIEERMLTEAFGDAYRTYREATRKLVPFIY
ncbi:MAG: hypothetical protein CL696_10740 [Chloroflexi bacterium]|nr:hypothetical protein [Chloroflexota bacterium]|tara:strand:- start:525 stop:1022 length:498 start_codon:yes stop_codon:yes gene_type:complete